MNLCRQRHKLYLKTTGCWHWENNYSTFFPVWSHQTDSHLCNSKCNTKPNYTRGQGWSKGLEWKSLMLVILSGQRQAQRCMKVNMRGFKSDIGVLYPQLSAAAASRVYKRNKRESSEKLSVTANTLEHNYGGEGKGGNGHLAWTGLL